MAKTTCGRKPWRTPTEAKSKRNNLVEGYAWTEGWSYSVQDAVREIQLGTDAPKPPLTLSFFGAKISLEPDESYTMGEPCRFTGAESTQSCGVGLLYPVYSKAIPKLQAFTPSRSSWCFGHSHFL